MASYAVRLKATELVVCGRAFRRDKGRAGSRAIRYLSVAGGLAVPEAVVATIVRVAGVTTGR